MLPKLALTILLFAKVLFVTRVKAGEFIDLTYAFNNETALYPGLTRATQNTEREGFREGGWYASRGLCISEHTGTHIDSPYHFWETGRTLDQIPLDDLVDVNGVLIDVYHKVHTYENGTLYLVENYALSREDVLDWEKVNGKIPPRSVVLVRTGWASRWQDNARYLGLKDSNTDTSKGHPSDPGWVNPLNFPGVGESAAKFLTMERQILGIGIDALSIDVGASNDFIAHRVLSARGAYILENVANLHLLPPKGFRIWAAPFKVDRGTGAPTRLLARLNK